MQGPVSAKSELKVQPHLSNLIATPITAPIYNRRSLLMFLLARANSAGVSEIFEVFLTLIFDPDNSTTGRALAGFRGGPDDGETFGRKAGAACTAQCTTGRDHEARAARRAGWTLPSFL